MSNYTKTAVAILLDTSGRVGVLEDKIKAHGYTLRYVEYCEDASTPGLLGQIRGVTDPRKKDVKIGLRSNKDYDDVVEILKHELRHIEEPEWDCGSRGVLWHGASAP